MNRSFIRTGINEKGQVTGAVDIENAKHSLSHLQASGVITTKEKIILNHAIMTQQKAPPKKTGGGFFSGPLNSLEYGNSINVNKLKNDLKLKDSDFKIAGMNGDYVFAIFFPVWIFLPLFHLHL